MRRIVKVTPIRYAALIVGAALLGAAVSCSSNKPRSSDEIFAEEMSLPQLYMTDPSRVEVVEKSNIAPFVHQETGEICWPVLECHAPDCPGAKPGQLHRFIIPDTSIFIKSDGTLGSNPERAGSAMQGCPECAKIQGESDQQRLQRYITYVKPYVMPEAARRLEELAAERQKRSD